MGDQPLEIKINLNVELWFGETNDDQEMDFNQNSSVREKRATRKIYGPDCQYKVPRLEIYGLLRKILRI